MLIKNGKVSTTMFVIGAIMGVVAYVLYFIGNGSADATPTIVSLVIACVGLIPCLVGAHAENGWIRMFSALLVAAMSVVITMNAFLL